MTATYTFDVFSSLDGYGSYGAPGNWGGYWGKQGPELLDRRLRPRTGREPDARRQQPRAYLPAHPARLGLTGDLVKPPWLTSSHSQFSGI